MCEIKIVTCVDSIPFLTLDGGGNLSAGKPSLSLLVYSDDPATFYLGGFVHCTFSNDP